MCVCVSVLCVHTRTREALKSSAVRERHSPGGLSGAIRRGARTAEQQQGTERNDDYGERSPGLSWWNSREEKRQKPDLVSGPPRALKNRRLLLLVDGDEPRERPGETGEGDGEKTQVGMDSPSGRYITCVLPCQQVLNLSLRASPPVRAPPPPHLEELFVNRSKSLPPASFEARS